MIDANRFNLIKNYANDGLSWT